MKKFSIIGITTIVLGTLIFLGYRTFFTKKLEIKVIEYNTYLKLKNSKDTYALLFTKNNDKTTNELEKEIYDSFKNRKTKIYEVNFDRISDKFYSYFLSDINIIRNTNDNVINIPTLVICKNGEFEYINEGYIESNKLIKELDLLDVK